MLVYNYNRISEDLLMKKINSLIVGRIISIFFLIFCFIDVDANFYLEYDGFTEFPSETNDSNTEPWGNYKNYIGAGKKFELDIISYTSTTTMFDELVEDLKLESLEINVTSSSDITCNISNLKPGDYSLNGNKFTLINNNYSTDDFEKIGRIICSFPNTEKFIKLSKDLWLNIELKGNNKNFVNNEIKKISNRYIYNFGVLNENYLKSLNNESGIESITFDGKVLEDGLGIKNVNQSLIKMNVLKKNENSNNMIYYSIENEKNSGKKELLTVNEKNIDLGYGGNAINIFEYTERKIFLDDYLEEEYDDVIGIDKDLLNDGEFTYLYLFNRVDNRSKVNTLKNLMISDVVISFKSELKNYIASVPYKVSSVTISSILTDSKSSYVNNYGNRKVNLKEGLNTILVKVKAENGNVATYTIKITREKNNDSSLKSISVDDKVINVKDGLLIYQTSVNNEVVKPVVKAVANDSKAKVEIDSFEELKEGNNEINITVTAANGMKSVYVIDIIRDKSISTNSKVRDIKIKNHDLKFNSDTLEYSLDIKGNESKLDIEVTTEHEKAKYLITGNKNLKNESIIKIKVTAEDEVTTTTYTINIKKSFDYKYLIIFLAIILLLLIIIIIIIKRKRRNVNLNDYNKSKQSRNDDINVNETVNHNYQQPLSNNNTNNDLLKSVIKKNIENVDFVPQKK